MIDREMRMLLYRAPADPDRLRMIRGIVEAIFPEADIDLGMHRGHLTFVVAWESTFFTVPPDPDRGYPDEDEIEIDYCSPRMYAEDGGLVRDGERPCGHCGLTADDDDAPDPCLGRIEGCAEGEVRSACCGHGSDDLMSRPYIAFAEGDGPIHTTIEFDDALRWFADRGIGPDCIKEEGEA